MRELRELEDAAPRARHARLADPAAAAARRRRRSRRSATACPMLSLDNAFSTATSSIAWGERVDAAGARPDRLRRRAEDRRPGDLAALRGRPARRAARPAATASPARTSRANVAHDRRDARSGCAGKQAVPAELEVRGEVFMPLAVVRGAEPPAGRGRRAALRQPAQRGGRAACARRTRASPRRATSTFFCYQLGAKEGGPRLRTHHETLDVAARRSASRSTRRSSSSTSSTRSPRSASACRSSATRSATRSTAWS